ncbi:hypothetical protein [Streptomyces sp. NPDC088358]|uniref:hypothetical protein n=1 Tax=Streptomyces sp. NPDC088358 TaxID=3365857 RepID=UPI0038208438
MSTAHRRGAAILSSAFIAATIALVPVGMQQASAAAPSETHVSTAVNVSKSNQDYTRGFKDGFKSGVRQGQRSCGDDERSATVLQKDKNKDKDYQRGFKDGFKSGFRQGQRSC